jgi:DNA-binding NarL/FixJ family response regulator
MRYVSGSQINTTFFCNPQRDRHRTLLFVTDGHGIPDRLRYAIERDLQLVTIEECESVAAIAPSYRDTLALVVVAPSQVADVEKHAAEVLRFHPLAMVAVMGMGGSMEPEVMSLLQTSTVIRGVLPMQMKLDVLTPILALMMRGGEYFPRELMRNASPKAREPEVVLTSAPMLAPVVGDNLSFLTKREHQILALVAKGLQNKSIASNLNLSEHTVKIHLHNIITKLGTHNRTEAAAMYLDGGGRRALPLPLAVGGYSYR